MKTFFWGYFSLKWRRLLRTLSFFIIGLLLLICIDSAPRPGEYVPSEYIISRNLFIAFLILIPTLSFIIEPFVIKIDKKEFVENSDNFILNVLNAKKEFITPANQIAGSIEKEISGTSISKTEDSSFAMKSNLKKSNSVIISTTADKNISTASDTEINFGNESIMKETPVSEGLPHLAQSSKDKIPPQINGLYNIIIRIVVFFVIYILLYTILYYTDFRIYTPIVVFISFFSSKPLTKYIISNFLHK